MSAIVSAANGNWSTPGSWVGGVIPGIGDTVTIGHAITVDVSTVVGTSPTAGNTVLTVQTGKTLTLAAPLSIRGGFLIQGTGQIIANAGQGIEFDPSNAASPTTAAYIGKIGSANGSSPALILNGALGNPCYVKTKLGSDPGSYAQLTDGDGPYTQAGLITATYCNFTNLGGSSRSAIITSPAAAGKFSLSHCTFNNCGEITQTYNIDTGAIYELLNCAWTNSLSAANLQLTAVNAITGSGSRKILDCVFDKTLHLYPPLHFDIERNYFGFSFDATDGDWDTFSGNFIRMTDSIGQINAAGNVVGNYIYYDEPTQFNPHFIGVLSHSRSQSVLQNIFDMNCNTGGGQEGDCVVISAGATGNCVVTVKNNLIVRGPSDLSVGTIIDALGNSFTSMIVEHNTVMTGKQGAFIGETYAGYNGMLQSFRSNLMVSKLGGEGYKLTDSGTDDNVPDYVSSGNCDYNAGFGLLAGSNLKGYNHLEFTSGSPGAHDIDGDPLFVDDTRNLVTWSTHKGGPGTYADALLRLAGNNTLIADLIAWVNGGFNIQKSALNNAGHDGVTIGALPFVSSTSISVSPNSIVANSTGNIITVTGVSTSWTPGTPGSPTFLVSGVTGAAKTAQTVNNTTSATLTVTASTGGNTGTITVSDGAGHTATITVVPNGFSPVPGKDTWWAYMQEWAGYLTTWFTVNNHPANDNGLAQTYYDGENCAYRLKDHFGGTSFDTLINEGWLAYNEYYVRPNSGGVQGFRNFTDGQLRDVLLANSRAANSLIGIQGILTNGSYVSQPVDMSDPVLSRETAYAITAMINAVRAGISLSGAQSARLAQLKAWAIGHCQQWVNGTAAYFRPFMGGITAKSLIYYYDHVSADADIITNLKAVADYAWTACWKDVAGTWGAGGAFLYTNNTSQGDPQDPFTQPTLNMLICPLYGWLFFKGQGANYRVQGDAIFQGGIPDYQGAVQVGGSYLGTRSAVNPVGKDWDQQLFWGPDYIMYAEGIQSSSMVANPTSIAANSLNNVITLVGTGTSWNSNTVFSVSGVTGGAVQSKNVTDATHATVTIQASSGGATGILVVSDGSIVSNGITVTPISPQSGTNSRRRPY